jgi:AraC family transcriptional regulator
MSDLTPQERADAIRAAIEARLTELMSVADIAAAVGLSPFHCARFFTIMHGESPIAYARRRRLEIAARRIAQDKDDKLIEIAFDACFESQEAFTRAFKRHFGLSPGEFRRLHLAYKPPGDIPMTLTPASAAAVTLKEGVTRRPAFRVAGLGDSFTMETRSAIPTLWDRFLPNLPLQEQLGAEAYGLVWTTSPEEAFHYIACVRVPDDAAPVGYETFDVPAQAYLDFRISLTAEPLHAQMNAAMQEIWGVRMPKLGLKPSGGPDFEYYPPDFQPGREGWLLMCIPVVA